MIEHTRQNDRVQTAGPSVVSPAKPGRSVIAFIFVFAVYTVSFSGCGTRTSEPAKKQTSTDNNSPKDSTQLSEPIEKTIDRDTTIARAEQLDATGDFVSAQRELRKLMLVNPKDVEVLFRLAGTEAQLGNLSDAVALLNQIPANHPEAGLPALGQSADWCFQLKRYDEAERRYRKLLQHAPQAAPALRQLAYMLNRQGRRHEAAVHIQELCKLGNVRQDELHSLIVLSDAMYDAPSSDTSAENPYWPIAPGGEARKRFNDEAYDETISLLHASVADGSAAPAIVALYGRAAIESQDEKRFHWWLARTDDLTRNFADYWAAVGARLLSRQRFSEAARALGEALNRDPTDLVSISRMRQTLGTLGNDAGAQLWFDRWNAVHSLVEANNRVAATSPPDPQAIAELAELLKKLDRRLESVMWKSIQAHYEGTAQTEMQKLNEQRESLLASSSAFPDQQTRLCGLDLDTYPLPKLAMPAIADSDLPAHDQDDHIATPAKFLNVAAQIGLQHTYSVASKPSQQHFAIYQTLGGGVAVIDYDLDGAIDLYLPQGSADPPTFTGTRTNQLFRNNDSTLVDVTSRTATIENQYSVSATVGDWNQDGFPDISVANIGQNTLLVNNGDGTFTTLITGSRNTNRIPTSSAIADITGDQLPDLIQLNYIDDPTMVTKPPQDEQGRVLLTVSPNNFTPSHDRIVKNDGKGGFAQESFDTDGDAYTGLGIIVTDLDGKPGNEVFVGNDTYPNQLWVRDTKTNEYSDVAALRGCAYGFSGGATGAMGIAIGDFDRNAAMDIYIANYENENANLFLQTGGTYQDRNVQYRLGAPSRQLVGFGSQAIDYDNDGRLDLVVTNGHLDDAKSIRGTYAQPLQLFCNLGNRFQLADNTKMSSYWKSKHVGRGLAKLDFNQDGLLDFVITHVEQPTALLINRTATDHHWLQLQLVGTTSERDGIGAKIQVRAGKKVLTEWTVAGDGYLSHNEDVACFGLGDSSEIDEVVIQWPSGKRQVMHHIPIDCRLMILENEDDPHTLFTARQ